MAAANDYVDIKGMGRLPLPPKDKAREKPRASGAVVRVIADVKAEKLRWLWPGRIPLGKITVLDGDPGLGKSFATLDLAARVSRGERMPDGSAGDVDGPAGVVLLGAEDCLSDTIRPRLDAAGADVSRIVALEGVLVEGEERMPRLSDLAELEEAIRKCGARLVVIDPLMAYLGGDAHRDQDVRQSLAPLAALAARLGVAILVVRHLNKGGGGNALYRGGGSIGIVGAARLGLLVAKDPDDAEGARRVLAVTKSNLAEVAPSLAYHLEPFDGVARVVWEGQSEHTSSSLLADRGGEEEQGALDEAVGFLTDALRDGSRPSKELQVEARNIGIAERTLRRAREKLGVVTVKRGRPGSAGQKWDWALPEDGQDPPKMATENDGHLRDSLATFAARTCRTCGCKTIVDGQPCTQCGYSAEAYA